MKKIRLGVNIDHVATLRQVRGGTTPYPNVLKAAEVAVKAGAKQITIHLREDRRHIQDHDLVLLAKKRPALLNLEIAATAEMLAKAIKYKPDWVCLVPEKREELTTEGGLNISKIEMKLAPFVQKLQKNKIKVSLFIEADPEQIETAARLQADAIELHTGKWVGLKGAAQKKEWKRLVAGAKLAHKRGLKVHAGHGLDLKTTKQITKLPYLAEVNIGHSIVCDAIFIGLKQAVKNILKALGSRSKTNR